MNICLSAGGTGGHIYPALALGDELVKQGHQIFYIGNEDKMEAKLVQDKPYTFLPIKNEGLKPGLLAKVKGITSQFKAISQCKKYLKENNIDIVVSFGGYVTFPVCVGAKHHKIPYLVHEQNSIAGKANKMVQKSAQGIIVCFKQVIEQFNHPDIRFLGNPRASIAYKSKVDEHYLDELGLDKELPLVYFVMGSLGSSTMSSMMIEALNSHTLSDFQVVIAAGRQVDFYKENLKEQPLVKVFETVDQIQLLKQTDLIVSRAGATSIAEINALGVPALYVPSPFVVANHQYYNALELSENGAAVLVEEKDLSSQKLFEMIDNLIHQPTNLQEMSENTKPFSKVDALETIIDWINEIAHES